MKKLIWILVVSLLVVVIKPELLIKQPSNVAQIVTVGQKHTDPLPYQEYQVIIQGKSQTVYTYDSVREWQSGELVNYLQQDEKIVLTEQYRLPSLVSLFALFVAVVVVVSGVNGIRSLIGLGFSFLIIFKFVLPQTMAGSNPIVVALLSSALILVVSYFLTHGINTKSVIAMISTLIALCLSGVLASFYGKISGLTGLGSEEAGFLLDYLKPVSFYQLLLGGIIIGSLGVLDDITIAQTAVVEELKRANSKLGIIELFERAMKVGHDHIASLVNTLVLVYAGAALPLLLLFLVSKSSYMELLNYEALAEEIVRTLVSSIGLVAAVPITTLIASYWYSSNK